MNRFSILHRFSFGSSGPLAAAVLTCAVGMLPVSAADWPSWRGPNANGSVSEGASPVKWDGTNVLWKTALPGKGSSTPIVWQEHVYLTAPVDDQDGVLAFDFAGKPLWQTKLGPAVSPKHRTLGSSCNASPVTDGKGIYVYFKSGNF